MFSAFNKMSLEESDVPTDEDCEELVEDGFTLPADISGKRTPRKKSTARPSPSPRSPYLSSLNMNSKRAAVAAWRLPRPSLGDTRGDTMKEHCSARHSNGQGAHYHKDKEGMYDEIIRLKKSLQAQKSDNQQLKAKLRRLEEDGAKRQKQIEELLDPSKGSEYTRSLVDKKKEGSVIVIGLKQRILKLEQQCKEKEKALSKLQSELRTTSLEELKITVEAYFEEIQRLRMLLDAADKSSRAESKCAQRQEKALSSAVHRLTENLKHLQRENAALREELNTESPAAGIKGYKEWSRQRLLRRLLEVERRVEETRRHAYSTTSSSKLNKKPEAIPKDAPGLPMATDAPVFAMATETVVSMGSVTEQEGEISVLTKHLSQLEEERVELQEGETNEQELEQLLKNIPTLEDRGKCVQTEDYSASLTIADNLEDDQHQESQETEKERAAGCLEKGEEGEEELEINVAMTEKEEAALTIQTNWRQHRKRVIVMLQSVIRGHLFRATCLMELQKTTEKRSENSISGINSGGGSDFTALTLMQSAFRGHLARLAINSSGFAAPSPTENDTPALVQRGAGFTHPPSRKAHPELRSAAELARGAAAAESDDSDDVVVSPSRHLKSRKP